MGKGKAELLPGTLEMLILQTLTRGDMLGYGTFRVETAGQDQALGQLDFLLYPEEFHDLVIAGPKFG